MSFITRCPACSTSFKVVSDQLKISDGWVRCGHCHHIFDATLDLQPWWPGVDEPRAVPPKPETAPAPAPQEPVPPVSAADAPSTEPSKTDEPQGEPAPVPDPMTDASEEPPAAEPPLQIDSPPAAAPDPLPSFVRQAQRRAFWRKPWVRGGLLLLLLSLLALLGVQVAHHWRDQLASRVPATRPALETLCDPLACEVASPRQLDDVVIDSSVLLRRGPGRYSFNVVVRNKSALEVAAPALELTLTALNDEVLVRRVLLPHEWPRPVNTLPPGAEWPVQFDLALDGPSDQVMTGYRAILFYP